MAYSGKYKVKNKEKLLFPTNYVIYRSLLERKFMKWLDFNDSCVKWAYEYPVIPYYYPVDKKWHRYYPDFLVQFQDENGSKKTWLVEIKPYSQTNKPKPKYTAKTGKKKKSYIKESLTYAKNTAKWNAAEAFCVKHNMTFKIVTEKEIR